MASIIYENIIRNTDNIKLSSNNVICSFIRGPKVEINGDEQGDYRVQFIDKKTNQIKYETTIKNNCWAKCSIEYYVDWEIKVFHKEKLFYVHNFNPENKRVYIALDSKALGDTLAWLPMVVEYSKVNKCKLIVSTFHNSLFEKQYPEVEFVQPGEVVQNLYAMYTIGLFYNADNTMNGLKHPLNFLKQPLQKMCSDILGLEHKEIKPKLKNRNIEKDDKLITIAIHGTAQPKYWNNPKGWQEVVDWLSGRGYKVKLLSRENDGYMGNKHPSGVIKQPPSTLDIIMDEMVKSKAFIGIGSGLSWLSWALGTKTVLISGFSYDWAEMEDCVRISAPENKCSGCFNRLRLDAGDWNWCPDHKGTDRQFECTKEITSEMVIKQLEKFL